tara:strand:+ start:177 stop:386 length:210 start_codon:yes stop_codon:yes gene_type:complete
MPRSSSVDVSSTKLAKTKQAKSVLDACRGMFKTMLQYKGDSAGCMVKVSMKLIQRAPVRRVARLAGRRA